MKVIYHIDEMDRWPLVLGNVKNMTAYYHEQKESYTIEVLANSAAVNGYAAASPEHEGPGRRRRGIRRLQQCPEGERHDEG